MNKCKYILVKDNSIFNLNGGKCCDYNYKRQPRVINVLKSADKIMNDKIEKNKIYTDEQCNLTYDDNYVEILKNDLFDMNKHLIRSFDLYSKNIFSINYDIANKKLLDQISSLKNEIYDLNLYKFCREKYETLDRNKAKHIMFELNIRRNIQIYINENYKNIEVTRGFLKMYDILNQFRLIDLSNESVNTFHACEAPGNFINATNHWIKSQKPDFTYNWKGNSLNPYNSDVILKFGNVVSDQYGYIKES
jgi:putative lipase involved disintegration of autophagic bodies